MRSDNSGVSERLFQEGVQYFVNHPDKWISRRELQEALGIKKTQACRLCDMLTVRLYLTPREQKADNSPLYLMLESEHMKSATKELTSISTLTEDDRRLLTILMDMADSSGLYGEMVKKLRSHIALSRYADRGIIPVNAYSPEMQFSEQTQTIIPTILRAVSESKSVWITYKSPWSETEKRYTVNPVGLFTQNDILYLYSYNPYFEHNVVHAVSRISDVSIFQDSFTPEEFKDLSKILDPFGIAVDDEPTEVIVWIDPEQAFFEKESMKNKNAKITDNPDGSITITISTRNLYACKRWIFSLGCLAKCQAPEEFVNDIKQELQETQNQYTIVEGIL